MAVAFNAWFRDADRIRVCDNDTLNMIDDMVAENVRFQGKRLEKKCDHMPYPHRW